jgi:hypothetical protein
VVNDCGFVLNRSAILLLCFAAATFADDNAPPQRKYSTVERMKLPRLQRAHQDAVRYQEQRKTLLPLPGLTDYRAILHAHAEDSTHTGGTREEMLADARRADVKVILLTDHHRPPKDFIDDTWRGVRDGVLFIPGSEARGFLIYPMQSILGRMNDPLPEFIESVRRDRGLIFLSHIEERPDHSMDQLDGLEIYNRHADAKRDLLGIAGIVLQMTDPELLREMEEGLRRYPDEMLASQCTYLDDYLAKWDRETGTKSESVFRRLTGVAANDCHHNQILIIKMVDENTVKIGTNVDPDEKYRSVSAILRPGIRQLTKGRQPGDVLAKLDFDPYYRSFRNGCTHILAAEQSESAVRLALRGGRAYVSHDWMCDPTGFRFQLLGSTGESSFTIMGDEIPYAPGQRLLAEFPVPCRIRLLDRGRLVAEATDSDRLDYAVPSPGVYRVEGWLTLDGEPRPWVYSNPIYVQ